MVFTFAAFWENDQLSGLTLYPQTGYEFFLSFLFYSYINIFVNSVRFNSRNILEFDEPSPVDVSAILASLCKACVNDSSQQQRRAVAVGTQVPSYDVPSYCRSMCSSDVNNTCVLGILWSWCNARPWWVYDIFRFVFLVYIAKYVIYLLRK